MTRKDYILIAESVRAAMDAAPSDTAREAVRDTAHKLAARLATTNPRFDRWAFLNACGAR